MPTMEDDHDHDDFESFVVRFDGVGDRDALLTRLSETITEHGILRLKGFIALDGADARLAVQAVGPRVNAYFDRPWAPEEARGSSLVVIGQKGLDEARIRDQLTG